jgi:hypothetical protein
VNIIPLFLSSIFVIFKSTPADPPHPIQKPPSSFFSRSPPVTYSSSREPTQAFRPGPHPPQPDENKGSLGSVSVSPPPAVLQCLPSLPSPGCTMISHSLRSCSHPCRRRLLAWFATRGSTGDSIGLAIPPKCPCHAFDPPPPGSTGSIQHGLVEFYGSRSSGQPPAVERSQDTPRLPALAAGSDVFSGSLAEGAEKSLAQGFKQGSPHRASERRYTQGPSERTKRTFPRY